jgi:hypothetical protein
MLVNFDIDILVINIRMQFNFRQIVEALVPFLQPLDRFGIPYQVFYSEFPIMDVICILCKPVRSIIVICWQLFVIHAVCAILRVITPSSIFALPGHNLSEIFPVIQKLLESGNLKRGALVYNGHQTLESKRARAMFAEGYEQGTNKVWRFAQVYRPAGKARLLKKGQPPERLGNLKFLAGSTELRIV